MEKLSMFEANIEDIQEVVESNYKEFDALSGNEISVTGCAGFLGRYFVEIIRHFNNNSDVKIKLVGIDNLVSSGRYGTTIADDKSANFKFFHCDFSKPSEEVLKQLEASAYLIHAAGIASPAHYKKLPLETLDVAVSGTRSLLDLAVRTGAKVTFFSSSEIYGNPPPHEIPIKETFKGNVSSTGPRSCYDESKRLGETLCTIYSGEFNVPTSIIRPFNVYGPGMQEFDYRVIPNFGFRLKKNVDLQVYGSGGQTRTYCYITDALSGILKVIVSGSSGNAYNVGNPLNEISALKLAEKFKKISRKSSNIQVIDHPENYPADEPERRCPDISKLEKLGYSPVVTLDDGLKQFWNYINLND